MKKLITLALGLVLSATAFAGDFADISVPDLKKAIAEKTVTVIDVNGSDSYKAGHIPTAIDYEKDSATSAIKPCRPTRRRSSSRIAVARSATPTRPPPRRPRNSATPT